MLNLEVLKLSDELFKQQSYQQSRTSILNVAQLSTLPVTLSTW